MKKVQRYEKRTSRPEEPHQIRYAFRGAKDDHLFEEASEFDAYDGFARLGLDGEKYLMDSQGFTYLLAESLDELTHDTEALDLHVGIPEELPESLGDFTELKVILAYQKEVWEGDDNRLLGPLTTLPKSIGKLFRLTTLDLSRNQLTHLPIEFGQLSSLRHLNLHQNKIQALPAEFGQLSKLKFLNLKSNRLTSIPPEISQLRNLKELNLAGNSVEGLPVALPALTELET